MTPDPVAKLAQFTPEPGAVDPAELLFAAGRASARTPWYWKATVAASLLANVVCVLLLATRSPEPLVQVHPAPDAVPAPQLQPRPPVAPESVPEPWSYQSLRGADVDSGPQV